MDSNRIQEQAKNYLLNCLSIGDIVEVSINAMELDNYFDNKPPYWISPGSKAKVKTSPFEAENGKIMVQVVFDQDPEQSLQQMDVSIFERLTNLNLESEC